MLVYSTGPEGRFDPQGIAAVPYDTDGEAWRCCAGMCYCYDGVEDQ